MFVYSLVCCCCLQSCKLTQVKVVHDVRSQDVLQLNQPAVLIGHVTDHVTRWWISHVTDHVTMWWCHGIHTCDSYCRETCPHLCLSSVHLYLRNHVTVSGGHVTITWLITWLVMWLTNECLGLPPFGESFFLSFCETLPLIFHLPVLLLSLLFGKNEREGVCVCERDSYMHLL